jgi:hypothetical protein
MAKQGQINPRRQGDLGEAAAIAWLTKIGAGVSVPLFHSPDYDLIAELRGQLLRVQVKTSRNVRRDTVQGRFNVMVATYGGNQSWNGLVKRFDLSRCDFLFVLVADGRRWFIPAHAVGGRRGITVGGPKYSEFEVDPEASSAFSLWPVLESLEPRGASETAEPGSTISAITATGGKQKGNDHAR